MESMHTDVIKSMKMTSDSKHRTNRKQSKPTLLKLNLGMGVLL